MAWTVVQNFERGLDARRMAISLPPGALAECTNAHVNRGGEVEKRLAFVAKYALPSGTFGLLVASRQLYVVGSAAAPLMPAGVTYQRLQHPTAEVMTKMLSYDVFDGKLYVVAQFANGDIYHFYDGTRVAAWVDGKASGSFQVTGGTASAGVNKTSSIKVNGVEVLNVAVDWVTSHAATATAIAAQINLFSSSPEYTAVASAQTVSIVASTAGTGSNGFEIVVVNAGDVTTSAPTTFSGGADGTFQPGPFCKTHKNKMYSISGSILHASAVADPTKLEEVDGDPTTAGAGFTNMSNQASGSEELTSIGVYFDQLAIFAKNAIQIFSVDADFELNVQLQALANIGCHAPRSVISISDNDVVFLAQSGIRSLRSRDSSNAAFTADIGTAIDPLVVASIKAHSDTHGDAVAVIDPVDNRLWMALDEEVWVYSNFPGSKISAWSKYELGFQVTDFAIAEDRVYARSGDTIYLVGGDSGMTYDTSEVTVTLPFLSAKKPDIQKMANAINLFCEGRWDVFLNTITKPDGAVFTKINSVRGTTAGLDMIPAIGKSTHFQLKLVNRTAERALISMVDLEQLDMA